MRAGLCSYTEEHGKTRILKKIKAYFEGIISKLLRKKVEEK
jgi:hypothetical protein